MGRDSLPPPATPEGPVGAWQELDDPAHGCRIFQRGRHGHGTFVRVYVPYQAEQPGQRLRVVLYLHGFALCLPSFYQAHLLQLVSQGWIVIFPDFQTSAYKEEPLDGASVRHAPPRWWATTRRLLGRGAAESLRREDLPEELVQDTEELGLGSALPQLRVVDVRRVLLAWLLIRGLLALIGWFRRNYARNLGQLIGTVLLSLAYKPTSWLLQVHSLSQAAWRDLAAMPRYGHWGPKPDEVYGFGHSLGGLLGLCLPALPSLLRPPATGAAATTASAEITGSAETTGTAETTASVAATASVTTPAPSSTSPPPLAATSASVLASGFQPLRLLAADPATSTEMGIPAFAIWLLKLFRSPFTADPLEIQRSGGQISQPTVIVHGLADTLVPPQLWAVQGGGGAFSSIASSAKALYFASSNQQKDPTLIAFHNQAVTSTQYYDDELFDSFGGVKYHPNAYNTTWIWPALQLLFAEGVDPENLVQELDKHAPGNERPFAVSTTPPAPQSKLAPVLAVAVVFGVAFVLLRWLLG